MRPNIFQLSTVEKAKKSRQTATKILPKLVPNTVPKAVWARFVFVITSPAAPISSPVYPPARIPPGVYRVEMIHQVSSQEAGKIHNQYK